MILNTNVAQLDKDTWIKYNSIWVRFPYLPPNALLAQLVVAED